MSKHIRYILPGQYDVQNNARCTSFGARVCLTICPRHDPSAYADMMARHASNVYGTGSI